MYELCHRPCTPITGRKGALISTLHKSFVHLFKKLVHSADYTCHQKTGMVRKCAQQNVMVSIYYWPSTVSISHKSIVMHVFLLHINKSDLNDLTCL